MTDNDKPNDRNEKKKPSHSHIQDRPDGEIDAKKDPDKNFFAEDNEYEDEDTIDLTEAIGELSDDEEEDVVELDDDVVDLLDDDDGVIDLGEGHEREPEDEPRVGLYSESDLPSSFDEIEAFEEDMFRPDKFLEDEDTIVLEESADFEETHPDKPDLSPLDDPASHEETIILSHDDAPDLPDGHDYFNEDMEEEIISFDDSADLEDLPLKDDLDELGNIMALDEDGGGEDEEALIHLDIGDESETGAPEMEGDSDEGDVIDLESSLSSRTSRDDETIALNALEDEDVMEDSFDSEDESAPSEDFYEKTMALSDIEDESLTGESEEVEEFIELDEEGSTGEALHEETIILSEMDDDESIADDEFEDRTVDDKTLTPLKAESYEEETIVLSDSDDTLSFDNMPEDDSVIDLDEPNEFHPDASDQDTVVVSEDETIALSAEEDTEEIVDLAPSRRMIDEEDEGFLDDEDLELEEIRENGTEFEEEDFGGSEEEDIIDLDAGMIVKSTQKASGNDETAMTEDVQSGDIMDTSPAVFSEIAEDEADVDVADSQTDMHAADEAESFELSEAEGTFADEDASETFEAIEDEASAVDDGMAPESDFEPVPDVADSLSVKAETYEDDDTIELEEPLDEQSEQYVEGEMDHPVDESADEEMFDIDAKDEAETMGDGDPRRRTEFDDDTNETLEGSIGLIDALDADISIDEQQEKDLIALLKMDLGSKSDMPDDLFDFEFEGKKQTVQDDETPASGLDELNDELSDIEDDALADMDADFTDKISEDESMPFPDEDADADDDILAGVNDLSAEEDEPIPALAAMDSPSVSEDDRMLEDGLDDFQDGLKDDGLLPDEKPWDTELEEPDPQEKVTPMPSLIAGEGVDETVLSDDAPKTGETGMEMNQNNVVLGSISVSTKQIETVMEKVIQKMFSEKIERLIVDVVEKAVAKELGKLKNILMEDLVDEE